MSVGIQNFPNINPPDSDYPSGSIKDDTGANDGTPIDQETNGDIQEFFAKLMRLAGITPNGLLDNEYTGHQYIDAMKALINNTPIGVWNYGNSTTGFHMINPTDLTVAGYIYQWKFLDPISVYFEFNAVINAPTTESATISILFPLPFAKRVKSSQPDQMVYFLQNTTIMPAHIGQNFTDSSHFAFASPGGVKAGDSFVINGSFVIEI